MKTSNLHSKVEDALQSLDHVSRAEANPFLYTRVLAQLKAPAPGIFKPLAIWQLTTTMIIVLVLNIGIGLYSLKKMSLGNQPAESGYFTNHIYTY